MSLNITPVFDKTPKANSSKRIIIINPAKDFNESSRVDENFAIRSIYEHGFKYATPYLSNAQKMYLKNKDCIQVNEINSSGVSPSVLGFKIFNNKGEIIQQAKFESELPEFLADFGFQDGALVLEDGDLKYYFPNLKGRANLFQNIREKNDGTAFLPVAVQTLSNGIIKYYAPESSANKNIGYIFPSGEEIWIDFEGNITLKEEYKGILKKGTMTKASKIPFNNRKGEAMVGNLFPYRSKVQIEMYDKEEKEIIRKFLEKFIPDKKIMQFQTPLNLDNDLDEIVRKSNKIQLFDNIHYIDENTIEQFISQGADFVDIEDIKNILKFFEQQGV